MNWKLLCPPWGLGCVCTVWAPGLVSLLLRRCQKPRLESDAMMGGSHPGLWAWSSKHKQQPEKQHQGKAAGLTPLSQRSEWPRRGWSAHARSPDHVSPWTQPGVQHHVAQWGSDLSPTPTRWGHFLCNLPDWWLCSFLLHASGDRVLTTMCERQSNLTAASVERLSFHSCLQSARGLVQWCCYPFPSPRDTQVFVAATPAARPPVAHMDIPHSLKVRIWWWGAEGRDLRGTMTNHRDLGRVCPKCSLSAPPVLQSVPLTPLPKHGPVQPARGLPEGHAGGLHHPKSGDGGSGCVLGRGQFQKAVCMLPEGQDHSPFTSFLAWPLALAPAPSITPRLKGPPFWFSNCWLNE